MTTIIRQETSNGINTVICEEVYWVYAAEMMCFLNAKFGGPKAPYIFFLEGEE